jgi:hypothetical protein
MTAYHPCIRLRVRVWSRMLLACVALLALGLSACQDVESNQDIGEQQSALLTPATMAAPGQQYLLLLN